MTGREVIYAITGATGNTGRPIAEALLATGKQVRVLGRSAGRLQPLVEKGAEAFTGEPDDEDVLKKAFDGAAAVYSLIPPNLASPDYREYQKQVSEAQVQALRGSSVRHIVVLSSWGAQLEEGTGPILGLHDHEQRLNRLEKVSILHLRAGYFMENFLMMIPAVKTMGTMVGPLRRDLPVPMIATKDVAAFAADALLQLDFTGRVARELHGHRDVSMAKAAGILGRAIGRDDLEYKEVPYLVAEQGLTMLGLPKKSAQLYIEMAKSINEGTLVSLEPRSPANTTPTSIEEFAPVFAAAFNA